MDSKESWKDYWGDRTRTGKWGALSSQKVNAYNYNFITRREGVRQLLESDGKIERILDIGCGTADYFELAELHQASYHGVDYSKNMLEQAIPRIGGLGKQHLLLVGSGDTLPYPDNSFDLVLAIGYIEYFSDPIPTIREISRVLKPNGTLVMQSFKRDLFCTLDGLLINRLWRTYRRLFSRGNSQASSKLSITHYSGRGLDRLLSPFGFERMDYRFNNHYVLPRVLQMKFPELYIRISENLNRSNSTLLSFLAVNYIGKYTLRKDQSH